MSPARRMARGSPCSFQSFFCTTIGPSGSLGLNRGRVSLYGDSKTMLLALPFFATDQPMHNNI
ncbi:hypothetical protein T07_13404 [Trichinella nelsoni]|uniref:Uncharacterized protein n=1 Tax=Trichinella nelsoni TaxID=6336 RepID=A0A0V0S7I8_9BILA|nr:hypothetical protein T07_13404 [Trichinella nelsoni]